MSELDELRAERDDAHTSQVGLLRRIVRVGRIASGALEALDAAERERDAALAFIDQVKDLQRETYGFGSELHVGMIRLMKSAPPTTRNPRTPGEETTP